MSPTTLTDTVDNTTFGYLYVKEFKYLYPQDNEFTGGHPKRGRVYRGVKNNDTSTHRLFYENNGKLTGLFLPTLNGKEGGANMYISDVAEITRNNILEFDINTEDIDSMCKWIDEDNAPVKQLMGFVVSPAAVVHPLAQQKAPTIEDIVKAVLGAPRDESFINFAHSAQHLKDNNPQLFEGIAREVDFFNSQENNSITWVENSKILGPGKNIGDALEHLMVYGGADRRTNLNKLDLLIAIRFLTTELVRNIMQGEDE